MSGLGKSNLVPPLTPAVRSGKTEIFDIILGPESLRRHLSDRYQEESTFYYYWAGKELTSEAGQWMDLSGAALMCDQYSILDHFMRHGKLETSHDILFRLLCFSIEHLSLGCVKGLMRIIAARDDWFYEYNDGHPFVDSELGDDPPQIPTLSKGTMSRYQSITNRLLRCAALANIAVK